MNKPGQRLRFLFGASQRSRDKGGHSGEVERLQMDPRSRAITEHWLQLVQYFSAKSINIEALFQLAKPYGLSDRTVAKINWVTGLVRWRP